MNMIPLLDVLDTCLYGYDMVLMLWYDETSMQEMKSVICSVFYKCK
jgi:hypothetical protein